MLTKLRPLAVVLAAVVLVACEDSGTDVNLTAAFQGCPVAAYQIGATVSSVLTTGSCRLIIEGQQGGEYVDYYGFNLNSSTSVVINMLSTDVDSYLIVWNRTGQVVAYDDDSGTNFNARITTTLPAGNYVIGATTFWDAETGTYTLSSN
jgi:hypothetical protein